MLEVADGSIDFDHVSFKYSEHAKRQALDDVDLHIKSGEPIGIIGGTGSAKSTLVNLIARLYDVTEGTVRVGGVDVRNYDLDALRAGSAIVGSAASTSVMRCADSSAMVTMTKIIDSCIRLIRIWKP